MRVLVTGGAGFIGGHVVRHLLAAGHDVRVFDAMLPTVHGTGQPDVPDGARFVLGDLRDPDAVRSALRGIDVVSHQAAMVGRGREILDAPVYAACNDYGTAVLLARMTELGLSRLILASSVVLYGESRYRCAQHGRVAPGPREVADLDAGRFDPRCPSCGRPVEMEPVDETEPTDPRSVYAVTKLAQEHLVRVWARETGATAVGLRYHSVYGAGMPFNSPYSGIASTFRSAVEQGMAPEVFEDGRPMRDFIDVRDVAAANVAALSWRGPGFRAFNVATGTPHSIKDLADALVAATGAPAAMVSGRYRLGDVRHIVATPRRIMSELGWSAAIGFAEGIKEFATAPLRPAPAVTPSGHGDLTWS